MLGDTRAGEVSSDQTFKHLGETSSACGGQARQPGGKTWSGHTHPHPHTHLIKRGPMQFFGSVFRVRVQIEKSPLSKLLNQFRLR